MSNAPFRPSDLDTSSEGGSKFIGFCEVGVMDYEDKTADYDWADIFLVVNLKLKDSQYPQEMKILGSYDREPNGNIKTCSLLKKVYRFFDAIGFEGGPDVTGNIVDKDGNEIENLQHYLNKHHISTTPLDPPLKYYAYLYKEPSKKDPSTAYTTVYPRITENNEKGRAELESFIQFLKTKNLIKEVGSTPNATPNGSMPEGNANSQTQF